MRIGLLTFHSAHNYGAVLQAYAMQETIRDMGYDIEIIDYRPDYLIKQEIFPSLKNNLKVILRQIIEGLLLFWWRYKRKKAFNDFVELKLKLSSKKFGSIPFKNNMDYDLYIIGSDQVWNIKFTEGFDQVYWGDFQVGKFSKKISYAASMSNYALDSNEILEMSSLLSNFQSLSVREEALSQFIKRNFMKDAATVLDPTFLLDKSKWGIFGNKPKMKNKYILVYSVDLRTSALRIAESLANQLNATIIELTMLVDRNVINNRYQVASPEDFVGLFESAECVVTSSFHGTTFSIVFNKPFFSILHGSDKDSRQRTILGKLGLKDRLISQNTIPVFSSINYSHANLVLESLRRESFDFLRSNLT